MNQKLKNGLRRAAIGDGRRLAEDLRRQRSLIERGLIDPLCLGEALRQTEAALTILAEELGDAMDQETVVITTPHNLGRPVFADIIHKRNIEKVSEHA